MVDAPDASTLDAKSRSCCTALCSVWKLLIPVLVATVVYIWYNTIPVYFFRTYIKCGTLLDSSGSVVNNEKGYMLWRHSVTCAFHQSL